MVYPAFAADISCQSESEEVRETEQEIEDEILTIREALKFEREAISSSYSALWRDRSVRKRLLLAFVINIGQQLTGQGTLNGYSTPIYRRVFSGERKIALINASMPHSG
jgi:hypothetical protein